MGTIELDPNTLTSMGVLLNVLDNTFAADFVPQFLIDLNETLPLRNATFAFNPSKNKYELSVEFGVKVGEDNEGEAQHLGIGLSISVAPDPVSGGKRATEFGAKVEVPIPDSGLTHLTFQGIINRKLGDTLVAQCNFTEEQSLPLHALLGGVAPALGVLIPEELPIPLRQNLLLVLSGRVGSGFGKRLIVGVGFNAGVNLGELPLVGLYFKEEQTSAAFTVELLVASHEFSHAELKVINGALTELDSPLKIRPSSAGQQGLGRGAHLVSYLALGELTRTWYTPIQRTRSQNPFEARSTRQVARSSGDDSPLTLGLNGAWLAVQRAVGPVYIEKLGLTYKAGGIHFVPEIVLSVGDLRLILDGVSVRLPVPSGEVELRADGFGLEYENDALRVTGAFLRSTRGGCEEYAGMAALQLGVKGQTIGLGAIGAYAYVDGQPSLFLYATLSYPLGGPPFFFVTGLSAGFGYNRSLTSPTLEEVTSFPLVAQAVGGSGDPSTDSPGEVVSGQLSQLVRYIQVAPDQGFLALGVKFTSFKLLDGFALMTVMLGKTFELDLLGLARLQVPFKTDNPLVFLEMALLARFAPSEGLVTVRGQLTPASYLLGRSCRLTGGFAFSTWFAGDRAGDFVVTLGGYHPSFKVPGHYPVVPRIGFDWRVDGNISVRGEAYFALCAHAAMAGGRLEASFSAGSAWASFTIGADFLICWKPFAYEASLYQHFKAGLGCLSGSMGASLKVWGPEFGGYAKLDFFLFSVKVKFGNQSGPAPRPILWDDFRTSFLPASEDVCSVAVAEGLMRQIKPRDGEPLWVVNPKEFALSIGSVIPSKQAFHPGSPDTPVTGGGNQAFGVAPVAVRSADLSIDFHVTIQRSRTDVEPDKFTFTPVLRRVPSAMWGEPQIVGDRLRFPDVNGRSFVEGALSGLQVRPAVPPKGGITDRLPVARLQFEVEEAAGGYAFGTLPAFHESGDEDAGRRETIRTTILRNTQRDALLSSLGFDPAEDVVLTEEIAAAFVIPPQVKEAGESAQASA
ncbi:DUF6603 domain-containing protein [Sorangium sp. So ce1504]|uniref:DUF6603 domain-containing protein n=1 Tax=Sorangium sp. So ce1504 TaxID=3133337 RepID=UPI003F5DF13B